MKTAKAVSTEGIPQALGRGHCPVCALLTEFQERLIENTEAQDLAQLCNYHAWALAKAAPAEIAAGIFMKLLDNANLPNPRSNANCDFCEQIRQQEAVRLREMVEQFKRAKIQEWMKLQGTFCMIHVRQLDEVLPSELRNVLVQVTSRTRAELREELRVLLIQLSHGDRTGWGVLGRAAEFLTSQRGITT